jgi:hypothetical protein
MICAAMIADGAGMSRRGGLMPDTPPNATGDLWVMLAPGSMTIVLFVRCGRPRSRGLGTPVYILPAPTVIA